MRFKIEHLNEPLKWRGSFNSEFSFRKLADIPVRRSELRAYALVAKPAHQCGIFGS